MERTCIAERRACATNRVVMHVFSYPGYVTASELKHLASQCGTCRAQAFSLGPNRLAIKG